jgi:hypothetical protein
MHQTAVLANRGMFLASSRGRFRTKTMEVDNLQQPEELGRREQHEKTWRAIIMQPDG